MVKLRPESQSDPSPFMKRLTTSDNESRKKCNCELWRDKLISWNFLRNVFSRVTLYCRKIIMIRFENFALTINMLNLNHTSINVKDIVIKLSTWLSIRIICSKMVNSYVSRVTLFDQYYENGVIRISLSQ